MNTGPLHPNAGSNRIDAVVIGLHRYFGPFSRFPDDFLDGNQSVEYLGDLQFEQPFQEVGSSPRENDPRITVKPLNFQDPRSDDLSLFETVSRDFFGIWQSTEKN